MKKKKKNPKSIPKRSQIQSIKRKMNKKNPKKSIQKKTSKDPEDLREK